MAIVGKFPGVYTEITDLSQVVTSNSIVSCGYVGEAEFGPINKPTLVSNLRGYTTKFGELSAKYGYMGYSVAVAQDSINSHYVVRVVDEDTARYGFTRVPSEKETYTDDEIKEWFTDYEVNVETMGIIAKDSSAAFALTDEETGDVDNDTKSVMFIAAENPNNKNYKIRITDTTINTNKNYKTEKTVMPTTSSVQITVPEMFNAEGEQIFNQDDTIIVTNASVIDINGKYKVKDVKNTYYASGAIKTSGTDYNVGDQLAIVGLKLDGSLDDVVIEIDSVGDQGQVSAFHIVGSTSSMTDFNAGVYPTEYIESEEYDSTTQTGQNLTIEISKTSKLNVVCYDLDSPIEEDADPTAIINTRIQKYPDDDETTFGLTVYETVGKVTTVLENYPYCTLYEAKDQYGNSTFVEDVVNGKSNYINVYVNTENNVRLVPQETTETNKEGITHYSYKSLQNGTSGEKPSEKALINAWSLYNDRSQTDVSLLMNSGYAFEENASYQQAMLTVAEKRRDCFCLFDIPSTLSDMEEVLDWRQNVNSMNTYRGALFSPWPTTYNSVQGKRNFLMCPSAYIAKIMGNAVYPWIAADGPNRGNLTSSVVTPTGLSAYYDETEGGELYDKQVNCIIKNTVGYANWGQKTLQQKPSALDRINVARTVIYIETTLKDAARLHLFENNTAYERMQVTLQFSQFLDTVLNAEGIQRYQVICDDTNNTPAIIAQNQMVIDIYLWPTYTTEFIQLNTIVMGPDAEVTVSTNA